ncbi:TetR/AcrR family transcriptional regulator [uncultured Aquimarina sp.]|uniref:TetR/AcrR family transcriptional regulator n=1 Tax=uncultured Aquimarina sp. TaxID=575652 RepID=UPI002631463F|nr:TetR/AcrR family transcriptional regulator [uncultured Aquimarina sp.]
MNKKQAIVSSALKLLTTQGVHNTPMSAIAKDAGTGMGTIYNYFPNKEVLINWIYVDIKEKEKDVFLEFQSNRPIKAQFENYFISVVDFFIGNPSFFKFMEQLHASPIITEESREKGVKSVEPFLQLLSQGKKEHIIKNIEIEELLMFVGGAVLSYLRWYSIKPKTKKTSLKSQIQMTWDAIKE